MKTEEQKVAEFLKFMIQLNPGISASLKIRTFLDRWIDSRIDLLPGYEDPDEFTKIMERNFNEN